MKLRIGAESAGILVPASARRRSSDARLPLNWLRVTTRRWPIFSAKPRRSTSVCGRSAPSWTRRRPRGGEP